MRGLKRLVRDALTVKAPIRVSKNKKIVFVTLLPKERVVYGVLFAVIALNCLFVLEVVHVVFLKRWNSEVFAAITSLIGAILGVFVGHRG
ncbi:MAG TPA: hypothetical protein ENF76_06405 [Candidatus Bathyarchaeota archaeon]|nr:MAG: hypothetical protein DRO34_05320 [Candidatus Bathyarchaeota archaeon]HDI07976.1 hypothetical protein [Candidatus Bathyarchaeota archaeon]